MNALPPLPTRAEVAQYCNQSRTDHYISPRAVKYWEEVGWIRAHPAYRKPVRYAALDIINFLDGKVRPICQQTKTIRR